MSPRSQSPGDLDTSHALVKFSKKATKEISTTEFLTRVFKHIRSLPDRASQDRRQMREELVTMLGRLNVSPESAGPPYSEKVADEMREWLDVIGERTNYELSTDFEVLLATIEGEAEARRADEAQRRENAEVTVTEAVAEAVRGWEEAAAVGVGDGHGAGTENEWVVLTKSEDEFKDEIKGEEKGEWELIA